LPSPTELAMSSDYFDPQAGPDAAYDILIASFSFISAVAMLYYDYALTLPREIQFLWPPHCKQGWFTLACFLNRYIPIIGIFPIAISYIIPVNIAQCKGLYTIYYECFMIVVQILAGILCIVRVYSLYARSRRILGLLVFSSTGSIFTALVSIFLFRNAGSKTIIFVSPFGGCALYMPQIGGRFAAIAWIGGLLFDSVIFSLTLYKAFAIGRRVNLVNVILRDGTMYFLVLSLMNLANIMTLLFAAPFLKGTITSHMNVLSSILVNRLVLNLREQAANQSPTTFETVGSFRAAIPVSPDPLSMTSVQHHPPFVETVARETVASVSVGESTSQQLRVGIEPSLRGLSE